MTNVVAKLRTAGPTLGYPHPSAVRGSTVRELRPRGGRSPWRAFYRRLGDVFVVGAIGPEAQVNPKGFQRAIRLADVRLDAVEQE